MVIFNGIIIALVSFNALFVASANKLTNKSLFNESLFSLVQLCFFLSFSSALFLFHFFIYFLFVVNLFGRTPLYQLYFIEIFPANIKFDLSKLFYKHKLLIYLIYFFIISKFCYLNNNMLIY